MAHAIQTGAPPAHHDNPVSKAVYDALAAHDAAAASRFLASFVSLPGDDATQLIQMNRYWRRQLDRVAVDTVAVREYLMDDCATGDWIRHFKFSVLAVLLHHGLPIL